jgi:bifunctional DNase/RNase
MRPVDTIGISIEQTAGAPPVLLREHDKPYRLLPIFIGGRTTAIVAALQGAAPPRPLTFDLMAAIVDNLGAHVEKVEITELREGFLSRSWRSPD